MATAKNTNKNVEVQEAQAPEVNTADLVAENEALKAKLAEIEAREAAAKVAPVAPPVEDKVDIFVPKGYANDEPNQLISVNGVNYLLPRGKTSKVPKFVADEFYRSQKAQMALDEKQAQLLEAAK